MIKGIIDDETFLLILQKIKEAKALFETRLHE